jgi:hypothetical protein
MISQSIISIFLQHHRRFGVYRVAAELKANAGKAGVYKAP